MKIVSQNTTALSSANAHNGAAFRMLQGVIPQPVIMDRHGIILRTTGMMAVRRGLRLHPCGTGMADSEHGGTGA